MKTTIKTTQKATKIGGGLWLYLPSAIKSKFAIEEGEDIEFEIIANKSKEVNKVYKCLDCLHTFPETDEECPACPNCDGTRLEIYDEI